MILKTYEMLTQEPWVYHPEQIATLTDWQIEHLYARPAVERAKASAAKQKGEPVDDSKESDAQPEPGTPQFRPWVINQFLKMGISHAEAVRMFEEQAKQS